MWPMSSSVVVIVSVVAGVLVLVTVVAGFGVFTRKAFAAAVASVAVRDVETRDEAVTAALRQVDLFSRSQLDSTKDRLTAELTAREAAIGANLDAVRTEVRHELGRLGELVGRLGDVSAQRFGQVDESLRAHAEVAGHLAESTRTLRQALASPQARGQWGERMAEDVLRLSGFVENVNYRKQVQVGGPDAGAGGRPDFTFELPKGHVLHMDVKFPLSAYLRYVEAGSDTERAEHLKTFLRDVRTRVRELSRRNYVDTGRPTLDYVLLFLPNEQLSGFIHEHDPGLLDDALAQRVVMCSPLTLFAFLGVIRQAFDNFMIEQTSDEILQLVGSFNVQWRKYTESAQKVKRHFAQAHEEFDRLTTTRERAVERPLRRLEALREQRSLDVDGAPSLRAVGDDD